jgi:hypothetical protein
MAGKLSRSAFLDQLAPIVSEDAKRTAWGYQTEAGSLMALACGCGSPECRGWQLVNGDPVQLDDHFWSSSLGASKARLHELPPGFRRETESMSGC